MTRPAGENTGPGGCAGAVVRRPADGLFARGGEARTALFNWLVCAPKERRG